MKHLAKNGDKLYKRIHVALFVEGKQHHHDWRAPADRGYSHSDIDGVLMKVADYLEKRFPNHEFRMVELESNRFNFIGEEREYVRKS